MARVGSPLLQSLKINGQGLNAGAIISATYIESADLSTPSLILQLWDEASLIRDNFGLTKGAEIECEFASGLDPNAGSFTERFIVVVHPIVDSVINVEAMQKDCYELKKQAAAPKFYVDKSVSDILSDLVPNLTVDCSVRAAASTYHLNTGVNPSRLIKQIARDHGATCYISRGTLHFHSYRDLARRSGYATYGLHNRRADVPVLSLQPINNESHFERVTQKHWMSQGYQSDLITSGFDDKERIMLPTMEQWKLDNQSVYLLPVVVFDVIGRMELTAGTVIDLEAIKASDGELDQSLPRSLIVSRVAHHQINMGFVTRAVLGVVKNHE